MSEKRLKVGLAQISPVWLDRSATLEKVCDWVHKASLQGCRLVAFGETLVPGYPFWLANTDGARFESEVQKEIHAVYLEQAITIENGHLESVAHAAKAGQIEVLLGCYERPADRAGHTGYASLVRISSDGTVKHAHRKLVPTYEERLAWGHGDGHGLQVFPLEDFTVGGLNCWENWMPLVRSALYAQGENLHVAVWPGSKRNTEDITRFIAFESRSFVLSVSGVLAKTDIPERMPHRELILRSVPDVMANGGSCIAGPNGNWIVEPVDSSEQLVTAEIDYNFVLRERQNFDPSGHYSRPDVTQLMVNRERQSTVKLSSI